jgi:hypothetical protein
MEFRGKSGDKARRWRRRRVSAKGANRPAARAKVVYESIEYGVSSIGRGTISGGGWQEDTEHKKRSRHTLSGDGHGRRELRRRQFGHQVLAPGFRWLKAERLTPVWLITGAGTRHLVRVIPAANIPVSGFPLSAVAASSGLRSRLIGRQARVRDMKCKGANAAGPRAKVQK